MAVPRRPDARNCGLWATVVGPTGFIKSEAWARAAECGEPVGTCRACGGYVVPDTPPAHADDARVIWYVVRCVSCGHEAASPGGRILRRRQHGGGT